MTDVRNDDFTRINTVDDVIPLYKGNGLAEDRQYIGFETEICVYKKSQDGKPVAASSQECADLLQHLKNRGQQPQLEMASAVEYASPPFRVTEVPQLVKEIQTGWQEYNAAISEKGFTANDSALLPFVTLESAESNLVDRDRARGLVKGMKLHKNPEFLKVTLLCTSTQVSLSYKDPADLHDLLTTGYALQAPLYALFGNYPAFVEGKAERVDFNPRAAYYEKFGEQGGIPQSLLTATDGDDFIRKHAQQVFNTGLLYYYDHDKTLVWPEKPVTFEELKAIGLNTRTNYDLAESFIYSDLKVCNIRDEEGHPIGKRVEVRGLDAGELGVNAGVPFIHATLRDPVTREQVKALLADYGLTPDQDGWQQRVQEARHNAAFHGGKYIDVAFGVRPDGSAGNLKDFCRELGTLLELYAQRNPGIAPAIKPLTDICQTGLTQAEQKSQATKDYEHANRQLVTLANDNQPEITAKAKQHRI
ncbi:MAG: hypothetical protein ACAH80_15875 [Alphaproteobacteria bacterium]